jgi:hypothetical protein
LVHTPDAIHNRLANLELGRVHQPIRSWKRGIKGRRYNPTGRGPNSSGRPETRAGSALPVDHQSVLGWALSLVTKQSLLRAFRLSLLIITPTDEPRGHAAETLGRFRGRSESAEGAQGGIARRA